MSDSTTSGGHDAKGHTPQLGLYDFAAIEAKWQRYWQENRTFETPNPGAPEFDANRPKRFILDMFPYPSGAGLHVGHPLGYTATDIYARFSRMMGFNVLHPMGYDAFGLPAEQYAIETGVHPAVTTRRNIENMRRQLKLFGFSYDWSREFATCEPDYYKFTQWIFLQLFESWYDEACEWTTPGGHEVVGKARPVADLVAKLEGGAWSVDAGLNVVREAPSDDRRSWSSLTDVEKHDALNKRRLAYIDEVPVNWCPALGTVLANEEVTNEGRSDRGNHPVFRRPLRQWMLRITRFAERLENDLAGLDWPEPIKLMQRNWIGRSTGADVDFVICEAGSGGPVVDDETTWREARAKLGMPTDPEPFAIRVYTTRPDTLFGATYMVLAPEHPLVDRITTDPKRAEVEAYVSVAGHKSDLDRTADTKKKTGVFTGAFAINPVNEARIPIWVADYVLMGYGTGAIMAVPGQDQRDWDFAKTYDLPIIRTVQPPDDFDGEAYVGEGPAINSGLLDELGVADAKRVIIDWLQQRGLGKGAVNYKLRDWVFTRQRYWGEPFPILHSPDGRMHGLDESDLPLELPPIDDFKPPSSDDPNSLPEPPLGRATEWKTVQRDGETWRRDLNTMPQWAGSCWYYLRFCDPKNANRFASKEAEQYWMPVDTYVGGAEHAVLHLLYARFWHKLLFDLGQVSTLEPFQSLTNQGMIQSFAYKDDRGINVPVDRVEAKGEKFVDSNTGEPVTQIVAKMSKALKNVVNPDDVIAEFGADAFRCYEMFMGPLEADKPWNTRDVPGVFKLLARIWRLVMDQESGELSSALTDEPADRDALRILHKTIKKVGEDIEQFKFNTAIGQLFEFVNAITPLSKRPREVIEPFVLLVAPFAPHLAEELWSRLGHTDTLAYEPWPKYDADLARDDEIEIPVQILGKLRSRITIAADADEKTMEAAAMADPKIQEMLTGKTVRKVIVVKGRMINIVAN